MQSILQLIVIKNKNKIQKNKKKNHQIWHWQLFKSMSEQKTLEHLDTDYEVTYSVYYSWWQIL